MGKGTKENLQGFKNLGGLMQDLNSKVKLKFVTPLRSSSETI